MEFVIFLLLAVVAGKLWQRVGALERQVEQLERTQSFYSGARRMAQIEPARPSKSDTSSSQPAPIDSEQQAPTPPEPAPVDPPAEPAEPQPLTETVAYEAVPEEPETLEPAEVKPRFAFDFEDIFGRKLPIWAGGFALAIAGIFLVRYSIEAGLITPFVRVLLSFVFGAALLAGAEAAFRFEAKVKDPRVRQALAGAGLATLYGAFYLAGTAYGLIGAGAAFVGLALVTAGAIALSFRFGLPCAVIGLVGGFAAPMLVDSDSSNIPLLSFYLALVTGGLTWAGQSQGRSWLGYAALAAGLGWGALMMVTGIDTSSDFAALGLYLLILGTALPAFLHAHGGPSLPKLAAGAIATLQMAVIVSNAGFAPLTWGLYLLIAAAMAALGWRYPALRLGSLVSAGVGLWLLLIWSNPDDRQFAMVAAAQLVIFAGVPLALYIKRKAALLDLGQLSAVTLIMGAIVSARFAGWFSDEHEPLVALGIAIIAAVPAAAFAVLWSRKEEGETRKAVLLLAPAAILAFVALLYVTPAWLAPVSAAAIGVGLLLLLRAREALSLEMAAWAGVFVAVCALVFGPGFDAEASHLGAIAQEHDLPRALLRWGAAALPMLGLALVSRIDSARRVGEAGAVVLLYGVIAQGVPSQALAWIAALAGVALLWWQRDRFAAWGTAAAIAALWALPALGAWMMGGAGAVIGEPFLAKSAVPLRVIGLEVLPVCAALVAGVLRSEHYSRLRSAFMIALGVVLFVIAHSLYKQAWGINSLLAFEHYAMGERTLWQAALVLGAWAATQWLPEALRKPVALSLIGLSLAHFIWFTLILHNPIYSTQHVGPTPIANWLLPAYAVAIAGLWLGERQLSDAPGTVRHCVDAAVMLLVTLLAVSLLRQVFSGSLLTATAIGQNESLLLSLLGIVLAIGFLFIGSWKQLRSWRIGSLVLMLLAVLKVFLIDAAGLDGLLRIASFMALGFSLIGIGWVYSKQLGRQDAAADKQ